MVRLFATENLPTLSWFIFTIARLLRTCWVTRAALQHCRKQPKEGAVIRTLYAKFSNGETARVSLHFGNEPEAGNISAQFITTGLAEMKGPAPKFEAIHWEIFADAFKSINAEPGVVGYNYDTDLSKGIESISKEA
jgi:hypothetical protein